MNQTEELRQAITDLFLTGTDNDHDEDELLDLLEEVDFDAVRQALVTESRRIFEFEVASQADDAMNYRRTYQHQQVLLQGLLQGL